MTTATLTWFKSSYSSADGPDCVEVAVTPATIHIRDSKDKERAQLAVKGTSWTELLAFAADRWASLSDQGLQGASVPARGTGSAGSTRGGGR
ncbi:DUF397 domain-containing protein [Streptomyces sp. NPDC002676]